MSKKNIEDRFSIDIDAYLNGIDRQDKSQSEEYKELLEIGKFLANKDFSENSNKEEVYDRTLKNISKNEGENNMKKSRKITKVASIALVCVLGFSIIQTASAQEFIGKVLKTISLGHITISEEEPMEIETFLVPEVFKDKIFDENGNPLEELSGKIEKFYTADGEEIAEFDLETGEIITVAEWDRMMKEEKLVIKDATKLNDYTCFNVILPSYLPEGYEFDRAEFYKDDNDVIEDTKYIDIYFTNDKTGKHIYIQQRLADEETAYGTGASKVEKIKINGVDAIIYDDINIDWETNGVIYGISAKGEITRDELIKIAESIK